jgi:hypothetical protein
VTSNGFDQTVADAQATPVEPLDVADFDFEAYAAYEAAREERCRAFWAGDSGVLVYRRMRVAEVFSYGCRDMEASLRWQLGALQESMAYEADVPNFLEPWYGIGTIASAFGSNYVWKEGQAPAVEPRFSSVAEALQFPARPVADTAIGRQTLAMIDYFIDRTGGRLPISLTDTQSPLNIAGNVVDVNGLFMDMMDKPGDARAFFGKLGRLLSDFTNVQAERLGDRLVWPGHGFASARGFSGLGMSDDNAPMISGQQYLDLVAAAVAELARAYGGWAFHSCGNWADKIQTVLQVPGLRMVDAAFSPATDPAPCAPEPFREAFAGTGIVVNARIVGDAETVAGVADRLWRPGLKLIVVTYCRLPEEQQQAYERVRQICA